jgi:uncharacterized membrane protein HdeD (DUF308 family)
MLYQFNKILKEDILMRSKWQLFASVLQILIGLLAIAAFVILGSGGEPMTKWIVTLILSVAFVVLGIVGMIDSQSKK